MNESSNETGGQHARAAIRHGRHLRHQYRLHRRLHRLHRLSHGIGDGQDARCRERPGRNRRAGYELHKALADIARTGDKQLRGEAAQIVTGATSRLNDLMAMDRDAWHRPAHPGERRGWCIADTTRYTTPVVDRAGILV